MTKALPIEPLETRLPLALTRGDPSGIGPELALKVWLRNHGNPAVDPFFIAAEPEHLTALARSLGWIVPVEVADPETAASVFRRALPVIPLPFKVAGRPGEPDPRDAAGTIGSIETCLELVRAGKASAIVTNPISKEVLHRSGFPHPGHTEFLAELTQRFFGVVARPVMLLWSPLLATVPVTIHVPLAQVPMLLSSSLIVETAMIVARDFERSFGISNPRLALTGLNPHAGEGGDMGREEIEIIAPAIAELRAAGLAVSGPHPADTLFHAKARSHYDVAIGMYHDQALIPIKTLAFESAVNVTLGLPFVRTSPDHGTAFDIAGQGKADPASLIAALQLAGRLARNKCPAP
jgi:4-hydroxythreonine-4-phosphate dehydrogenase